MLKKANSFLNVFIGVSVGLFLGRTIFTVWDYFHHPDLYEIQSAPWYTGILFSAACLAVIVVICLVVKMILKKKIRKM